MGPGQYPQYTRADFGQEAAGSSSHRDHRAPQVSQAVSPTHSTRLTSRAEREREREREREKEREKKELCFSSTAIPQQNRREAGDCGQRKPAWGLLEQGTHSPRSAWTTANRSLPPWMDGRRAAAKHSATRTTGVNFCQDFHSKKSTMFVRHKRAQLASGMSASTQRQICSFISNCASASSTCSLLSSPNWSNLYVGHT